MLEFPRLKVIQKIKLALLLIMAALALSSLFQAANITLINLEKLEQWPRQKALFVGQFSEKQIEIEVDRDFADGLSHKAMPEYCFPHEADTTCLLLPENPYAWHSVLDDIELLQNPQHPEELEVLSLTGLWLPVVAYVVSVLLLFGAGKWFAASAWGEDKTWWNSAWISSEGAPLRVGFGATDAEPIRESGVSRKGIIFWSLMCLGITAIALPGLTIGSDASGLESIIIITIVLGVLLMVWYSVIRAYTRVIYQDKTGLIDATLFGVKRVPWTAIGNVELVNLNEQAQARFRRRFDAGRRPQSLHVYVVSDKQGRKILHLSHQMIPADAFSMLLERLRKLSDKKQQPTEAEAARLRAEWDRLASSMQGRPKSLFHAEYRGLLIALVLMLLPFVSGTLYLCYQSFWFVLGAERAQGEVIEIKNDKLPSLVVEYQPRDGVVYKIESDGAESYQSFKIGDRLTVFYEADDPENARLDLFWEIWIGPIVMSAITGIVILLVVMIARSIKSPMPGG